MLNRLITGAEQIFLTCGATDFRKQTDSLVSLVSMLFQLNPYADQCVFEEYIILETETCTVCESDLVVVGKRVVRTEVEFIPAKLIVKRVVQQIAKCSVCGTEESEQETCHFQKAAVPKPPLAHSLSTPSLIAQVMYQKFVLGLPFARQEKDWYRLGLYLSRADMANWIIRCSEEWLVPIYERIHEKLLECQVLHMDETRIQCNKEEQH